MLTLLLRIITIGPCLGHPVSGSRNLGLILQNFQIKEAVGGHPSSWLPRSTNHGFTADTYKPQNPTPCNQNVPKATRKVTTTVLLYAISIQRWVVMIPFYLSYYSDFLTLFRTCIADTSSSLSSSTGTESSESQHPAGDETISHPTTCAALTTEPCCSRRIALRSSLNKGIT